MIPPSQEGGGPRSAGFRSIGALAERVGNYAWTEDRLFELLGAWAGAPGDDPEVNVRCAAMSARHGRLAAAWVERLPVRAGVERSALIVPPPGPMADVLGTLESEGTAPDGLSGLVTVVLPRLLATYEEHLGDASPVAEGPVRDVLELAVSWITREIGLAEETLGGRSGGPDPVTERSRFCQDLEGRLEGVRGIFPVAPAS